MLDMIEELFESRNLYKVFDITPDNAENPGKLRAAYLKAALKYHPDKAQDEDREVQTRKFQLLTKIYNLLKDDDLRSEYNEAGDWPESDDFQVAPTSHGKLDVIAINEFKKVYQGSDEEREEVKRLYLEKDGNIFDIMDGLFFAEILTDEDRIDAIIKDLIKKREIKKIQEKPTFQAYRKKRIAKARKEAREADEMLEQKGLGGCDEDSLRQAIVSRRAQASSTFLEDLEKRYSKPAKERSGKKTKRK